MGKSDHYYALEKHVAHSWAKDACTRKTKSHEKALCRTGYACATNWEDDWNYNDVQKELFWALLQNASPSTATTTDGEHLGWLVRVWGCPYFLHPALPTSFHHTVSRTWVYMQANLLQVHLSDSLGREQDAWCKRCRPKYVGCSIDAGGIGWTLQIAPPGCSAPIPICIMCSRCKIQL